MLMCGFFSYRSTFTSVGIQLCTFDRELSIIIPAVVVGVLIDDMIMFS